MNKLNRLLLCGAVAALAAFTPACSTTGSGLDHSVSKDRPISAQQDIAFTGTVVYQHDNGGDFVIVSNSGNTYYPENLPSGCRHGGLRVHVTGKVEGFVDHGNAQRLAISDITPI